MHTSSLPGYIVNTNKFICELAPNSPGDRPVRAAVRRAPESSPKLTGHRRIGGGARQGSAGASRLVHVDLDAAVAGAAGRVVVGGDRFARGAAFDRDAVRIDPARRQVVARVGGAVERQRLVDLVAA